MNKTFNQAQKMQEAKEYIIKAFNISVADWYLLRLDIGLNFALKFKAVSNLSDKGFTTLIEDLQDDKPTFWNWWYYKFSMDDVFIMENILPKEETYKVIKQGLVCADLIKNFSHYYIQNL